MGVKVPKALKQSITIVQMLQFGLFFTHALYGLLIAQSYRPMIVVVLCIFQAIVFASLFGHFFWCALLLACDQARYQLSACYTSRMRVASAALLSLSCASFGESYWCAGKRT